MKWINVKDQLPAYGQRVLVRDVIIGIGQRVRTDKDGELWQFEGEPVTASFHRDVQLWMPLPT